MKIQEVTVEGYQSHVHSTFHFSPGLTVITGPSDAGKTAIIRALRWLAFNEPTGEAFLHTIRNSDGSVKEAVDQAKVSVTFDNGVTITKTRRKGKTSYTHSAYPNTWDKAEIPPEIKETLGLMKQEYGDFDTCLNFAFQLDPPFLLSESASVGAKVLGKLAGTEVVDRSISEVNKRTHKVRTDIAYADKQIGEIDVSLTEYFDLDTHDAQLKTAEAAFTQLTADRERHGTLTALKNSYRLNTERRIEYFDRVESLAGVVVAAATLSQVERQQARAEALADLDRKFWKAVQDQTEPRRVVRLTLKLEDVEKALNQVAMDYTAAAITLPALKRHYDDRIQVMADTAERIRVLRNGVAFAGTLTAVESINALLEYTEAARNRYMDASKEVQALQRKTAAMANLDSVQGAYEALVADYDRLKKITDIFDRYAARKAILSSAEHYVDEFSRNLDEAEQELHDAWEAAGGVCPLCGSEVKGV